MALDGRLNRLAWGLCFYEQFLSFWKTIPVRGKNVLGAKLSSDFTLINCADRQINSYSVHNS